MGLDGVVPGTAYTLLTPADSSFAVDLVQNLNLSSQKVSTALQTLAEKDPKWSRIRHITAGTSIGASDITCFFRNSNDFNYCVLGGGRGAGGARTAFNSSTAGRGGGLGYAAGGRSVPKAMTSAMLASSSGAGAGSKGAAVQMMFSKAMGASVNTPAQTVHPVALRGAIPGNTAANPYIEGQGMGRGKHLTKPSWSDGTESLAAPTGDSAHIGSKSDPTSSSAPPPHSSGAVSVSSNSRFDDAPNTSSKRTRAEEGHTPIPSGMSGFVRASSTGASFAAPPVQPVVNIATLPLKKSRWDT